MVGAGKSLGTGRHLGANGSQMHSDNSVSVAIADLAGKGETDLIQINGGKGCSTGTRVLILTGNGDGKTLRLPERCSLELTGKHDICGRTPGEQTLPSCSPTRARWLSREDHHEPSTRRTPLLARPSHSFGGLRRKQFVDPIVNSQPANSQQPSTECGAGVDIG